MTTASTYPKKSEGNNAVLPITEDREALLNLYEQYQTLRQYETTKLRESGTFFQVIISAFILASIGLGTNYNPLGIALALFAALFSIIGTLDIHRCYHHFLRWTLAAYNVEELLQLHNSNVKILPEDLKLNNLEDKQKQIKSSGYLYWTRYLFRKVWSDKVFNGTLFQTYLRVFALFLYGSIIVFATNLAQLLF